MARQRLTFDQTHAQLDRLEERDMTAVKQNA